MFGHLKGKDFVNLIEGLQLPAKYRSHLNACGRCRAAWKSLESMHSEVGSLDSDIPEPDWVEFRSSVRDRLLSRSIQRETAVRRWTGWAIRPAMAWVLSLLLVIGVTTVAVMWHTGKPASPAVSRDLPAADVASESIEAVPERALFDDLMQLGDEEQERLQQILDASRK